MDREIKFRALVDGVMVYPQDLFGDVRGEVLISLSGEPYLFAESSNGNYCPSTIDAKRKAKTILMQFTGLSDKNGTEIYEGDVLKSKPYLFDGTYIISKVEFNQQRAMWMCVEIRDGEPDTEYLHEALKPSHETEIIGNIYENPEPLQEVEKGMKENKSS